MDIVGYSDRLGVTPGEPIRFMVSCTRPRYEAQVVRLIHGDEHPDGPGFREEAVETPLTGEYPGRVQALERGSYGLVPGDAGLQLGSSFALLAWICPTTPGRGAQGIVTRRDGAEGWGLVLEEDGSLGLRVGGERLRTGVPMRAWEWYLVTASVEGGRARIVQRPLRSFLLGESAAAVELPLGTAPGPVESPVVIAGWIEGGKARGHFNGRVEAPRIYGRALTEAELDAPSAGGLVAAWDFSLDIPTGRITDVSGNGHHGELVNMPMRAVTGHNWTGAEHDWKHAPEEYGAVHFHDDDLGNANWEADLELTVPELRSGVYAVRLRSGESEDYLPFFVRARPDGPAAPIAFLAPTLSYMAYANEHFSWSSDFAVWAPGNVLERLAPTDRYMDEQRLLSLYDFHSDGTGACYSSYLRPLLSLRPKYDMPLISAPHQFGADLHLLDWMETKGFERDVLTDHDLHREGAPLLRRYRVIVTGTHPEYWTGAMLDALEAYLDGGGRLMYLGGNGFWWVTSIHPDRPHVIELRRGLAGSRPWSSRPGEVHHGGTGEFGGQWRYRGRPPQRLVGVGFTAQGSDASRPYRRLRDSFDPRAAFIFEGVGEDEAIGDFGIVMGAAGGAEIDRADPALGTPPHALVLASATGYTDMYQAQQDDTLFHDSRQGGTVSPLVRADMVYFETPNGGAVFAPGSISWCGSLSHNGYDNNVSRITENVLRRFMAG